MNLSTGDTFEMTEAQAESLRKLKQDLGAQASESRFKVPMAPDAEPMKEATAAKVGMRELTENETILVRRAREVGGQIEALLKEMDLSTLDIDRRWQNIAKTHFQEGLMAVTRSITRPAFF